MAKRVNDANLGVTKIFGGGCKTYVYVAEKKNFNAARQACKKLSLDLASIPSYKEFDVIVKNLKGILTRAWVGAQVNGKDTKNDWEWLSGEPISLDNKLWTRRKGYREPGETWRCGQLMADDNGKVNDGKGPSLGTHPCTYEKSVLCEVL